MVNIVLLQLILYNFLQNHIKWAIILNCWDLKTQTKLTEMLMDQNLYIQLWPINSMDLQGDIEERYLLHHQPQVGVFFDFNCFKSEEVLKKTSDRKLFKDHFHWLIYDVSSDMTNFYQLFENLHMAVDADVAYVIPNSAVINTSRNSTFIIYDVYNNGHYLGGKLNMTADRELQCSPKECQDKQYLSSLHERSKYENRWLLKDITMRVATVVTYKPLSEPPEKLLEFLESVGDKDAIARFGFAYLMILKENIGCNLFYNFTNGWSHNDLTGGCVGALGIEQSVELASSAFLSSKGRITILQPTMPLGNFRQVCIFRTPHNAGIRGKVYLEPFSSMVWFLFAAIIILIGFLLWCIFAVEGHQLKLRLQFLPSLLTSFLVSFGSACCQGSFVVPLSTGGRITFFSFSLMTFIIYNYYNSIVVAILLGSPVKSDIKTISQLAESNLEVGLEPIPYTRTFLNLSTLPEIRSFVRNKIHSKNNPDTVWIPISEGIRRVRDDPGFVYVTDSLSSYGLIERSYTAQEICDLNEILLRPVQILYVHVHRNSSYKEFLKLKQYRILESGIYYRLKSIWSKTSLHCYLSSGALVQVGWEYTAPLFIMLASVYILVVILLLLEIVWSKYIEGSRVDSFLKWRN